MNWTSKMAVLGRGKGIRMNSTKEPACEIVQGIVVPTAWGTQGEPCRVAVLTPDEGEFHVAPFMAGAVLLSHLREEVEVRIVQTTGQEGARTITVGSFTVISDHGWDDDTNNEAAAEHADGMGRGSSGRHGG